MEEQLLPFGRLLVPSEISPVAAVVFYPPATGEKDQQYAEAQRLVTYKVASLLYDPPYRRSVLQGKKQGAIGDPEGEIKLWHAARSEFPSRTISAKDLRIRGCQSSWSEKTLVARLPHTRLMIR